MLHGLSIKQDIFETEQNVSEKTYEGRTLKSSQHPQKLIDRHQWILKTQSLFCVCPWPAVKQWDSQKPFEWEWSYQVPSDRLIVSALLQVTVPQSNALKAYYMYWLRRSRSRLPLQRQAVSKTPQVFHTVSFQVKQDRSSFENLCSLEISANSITNFLGEKKINDIFPPLFIQLWGM